MAKLIFKLRDVGIDEIAEVRQLLEENSIDVYETQGGMFGLSLAGLWVHDDTQYARVRELLSEYAQTRQLSVQAQPRVGLVQFALAHPLRALLSAVSVVIVLFVSIWPFLRVGGE